MRRKASWRLTLRGWLLLAVVAISTVCFLGAGIYPFLAQHDPVRAQLLVVEGWLPDYALRAAVSEFKQGGYRFIVTTGGPLAQGYHLSHYKTYSELSAATLTVLGLDKKYIQPVTAPHVRKDRTYASALALKRWLLETDPSIRSLNVLSLGPHARRSRLLFRKALGESFSVGVINLGSLDYDPKRWWTSSSGFRAMLGESIAYVYARFIFNP